MTFKQIFFRIYDRKIASGEITFSQSGIDKEDFTSLCTEVDFVFEKDKLERLAVTMKMSDEERKALWESSGYDQEGAKK